MPFANEHACRVKSPDGFQANSFRRMQQKSGGKPITFIIGRPTGKQTTSLQAYRYPIDSWSAAEAKSHCDNHNGIRFEPATGSDT